jgi:hypothetical protein
MAGGRLANDGGASGNPMVRRTIFKREITRPAPRRFGTLSYAKVCQASLESGKSPSLSSEHARVHRGGRRTDGAHATWRPATWRYREGTRGRTGPGCPGTRPARANMDPTTPWGHPGNGSICEPPSRRGHACQHDVRGGGRGSRNTGRASRAMLIPASRSEASKLGSSSLR